MILPESPYDQLPGESVVDWCRRRVAVAREEGRDCRCGLVQSHGEGARFSLSHGRGCPAGEASK